MEHDNTIKKRITTINTIPTSNSTSLAIKNIIEGTYLSMHKRGRSWVIIYKTIFEEYCEISIKELKEMGLIPYTVIPSEIINYEKRISDLFSNDKESFLFATIVNDQVTPVSVLNATKQYVVDYNFIPSKSRDLFTKLYRRCKVLRPDIESNPYANICYLEIMNSFEPDKRKYEKEKKRILKMKKKLEMKANKRAPYGVAKNVVLGFAKEFRLILNTTPSREEILNILSAIEREHDIVLTEQSLRKILQRGGYAAKKRVKKK